MWRSASLLWEFGCGLQLQRDVSMGSGSSKVGKQGAREGRAYVNPGGERAVQDRLHLPEHRKRAASAALRLWTQRGSTFSCGAMLFCRMVSSRTRFVAVVWRLSTGCTGPQCSPDERRDYPVALPIHLRT